MFEFIIDLGVGGGVAIVLAAVLFGVIVQSIGEARAGMEWLADALAFGIGALVASEFIVAWQAVGPVWDGLALAPALLGGLIVGAIVEIATRVATGGSYTGHHMAA